MSATGCANFADAACSYACLDYRPYLKPDPGLYRTAEVNLLRGPAGKTHQPLGWTHRIGFDELVREMVDADTAPVVPSRER